MAGINSILNIASSSIVAQRVAMEVTGENITNVNTPGYSRQRAIFETAPTTTSLGFPLGNGVVINTVQRFYDAALQKNITDGNSAFQNSQSRLLAMQSVEPSFNELTSDGLGAAMQKFFDAWQSLTANAAGLPERQTLLSRSQILVDNFHQVNQNLRTAQTNANNALVGLSANITEKASRIASLNEQIQLTEGVGGSASELRDQREYLTQELSKQVGITFSENQNGSLTVKLLGGQTLVEGNQYATVYTDPVASVDPNTINPQYGLRITAYGNPPKAADRVRDVEITGTVGGANNSLGEVGATLAVRDSIIPGYLQKLDQLAYNLADQVNSQHKQGWSLNNALGDNFFTATTAFNVVSNIDTSTLRVGDMVTGPGIPSGTTIARVDSATQITLSPPLVQEVAGGGGLFTFPSGQQMGTVRSLAGYSATIGLNIANTNDIAAADTSPLYGGTGNNGNALAMTQLRDKQVTFAGGASSSVSSYINSLESTVGVETQLYKNAAAQGESYVKQLYNLRESNSGVSLDEELGNLIKYQKAFEGAAKLISTASEMMDTVLGIVR